MLLGAAPDAEWTAGCGQWLGLHTLSWRTRALGLNPDTEDCLLAGSTPHGAERLCGGQQQE